MSDNSSTQWMPTAGGVLNIISGVLGIIASLGVFLLAVVFPSIDWLEYNHSHYSNDFLVQFENISVAVIWFVGILTLILSVFILISGIVALRRKSWGLALAGSICSLVSTNILGIIALVFIAMSRKEFTSQEPDRLLN